MRTTFSLCVACLLAACATTPPALVTSAPPPTTAAAGQPASNTQAAAPAPATKESQAATESWARNNGYKPTMKAGNIWWCKNEPNLGTRIANAKPNCASIQSLVELQRNSADSKQGIAERVGMCTGSGAGMQCQDTK